MSDVVVSWSGGKDCTLACYRAIQNGLEVRYLASIINKDTGKLWPHMLTPKVLGLQAEAMGIPFLQWKATAEGYSEDYRQMLCRLKEQGIGGAVFGDVRVGNESAKQHLGWIKSVCEPTGIKYYLPLWEDDREALLSELINLGFEVRILAVDSVELGEGWLGRRLDKEMLNELKLRHKLSPNGGVGYYHTFVTDGPIFKYRLKIGKWEKMFDDRAKFGGMGVWYMDIKECSLENKREVAGIAISSVE